MAASKCCAVSSGQMAAGGHVSLASALAQLNVASASVSVEPSDYNWGTPSLLQQQALYSQFLQLAFMCSLPQMQYAACPGLQAGRPAVFPSFMPSFAGFMPPVATPCPAPSPSPLPCSPTVPQVSGQQGKTAAVRLDAAGVKTGKNFSPSKKSGSGSKSKIPKSTVIVNGSPASPPAGVPKVEADIELEDICRLLGDDAFLEHLQDDVMSEGSNGSSSTSDGRVLSKNNNGCLSGSVNNNDGGLFSGNNNFAAAFDLDMDDLTATATATAPEYNAPQPQATQQQPTKASSGDLNNMVASSAPPSRSTRASRSAAREAAAAVGAGSAGSGGSTKLSLRVSKGGVQKSGGS